MRVRREGGIEVGAGRRAGEGVRRHGSVTMRGGAGVVNVTQGVIAARFSTGLPSSP